MVDFVICFPPLILVMNYYSVFTHHPFSNHIFYINVAENMQNYIIEGYRLDNLELRKYIAVCCYTVYVNDVEQNRANSGVRIPEVIWH